MGRSEFLKKVFRYILFILLTGITILVGKRIVSGSNCSSCPGEGICAGENDCSKYLLNKDGKA
jgi:hypothetical protein